MSRIFAPQLIWVQKDSGLYFIFRIQKQTYFQCIKFSSIRISKRFNQNFEAKSLSFHSKYYILRPETIESYFILWRLTHDQKYRDWAWDAVEAIERYCRTDSGFSGIQNVYSIYPQKNDVQESFFLAEVLKVR